MLIRGLPVNFDQDATALRCPSCDEYGGLHQEIITVYPAKGGVIEINSRNGNIRTWGSGTPQEALNPSMYRDGLTVHFSCEHCGGFEDVQQTLRMAQHKGLTLVDWEERET